MTYHMASYDQMVRTEQSTMFLACCPKLAVTCRPKLTELSVLLDASHANMGCYCQRSVSGSVPCKYFDC